MIFERSVTPLGATLLVLPQSSLMSLAATLDPLRAANRVTGRRLYDWRLSSPDGEIVPASCGLPITVDGPFRADDRRDLLVVIGGFEIFAQATKSLLHKVRRAAAGAMAVGGVEAGAWLLALAGLLDGRRATTHWEDLEAFAARFPSIDVRPDRYVIDGPTFTTGGAMPTLELMLALIRARQGHAVALDVASVFIYDTVRARSDAQPSVSLGTIDRHEPRLARAIRIMEDRLETPLTIAAIAARAGLSARSLDLLFQRHLATSPGSYYLALRLGMARRLIADAHLSLADVAARTGFSSASTLSRAFRRRLGMPPGAARRGAWLSASGS
jgi:transcriptional regulator GlxA family with amidase domain